MASGLRVDIVRFVDAHQPGIVECEFADAEGERHKLIDKVPMFTNEDLWTDSIYPRPGVVGCRILGRLESDRSGENLRVTIAFLDGVESTKGKTEFTVFDSQILMRG